MSDPIDDERLLTALARAAEDALAKAREVAEQAKTTNDPVELARLARRLERLTDVVCRNVELEHELVLKGRHRRRRQRMRLERLPADATRH